VFELPFKLKNLARLTLPNVAFLILFPGPSPVMSDAVIRCLKTKKVSQMFLSEKVLEN
jgi:hypothetical protein